VWGQACIGSCRDSTRVFVASMRHDERPGRRAGLRNRLGEQFVDERPQLCRGLRVELAGDCGFPHDGHSGFAVHNRIILGGPGTMDIGNFTGYTLIRAAAATIYK